MGGFNKTRFFFESCYSSLAPYSDGACWTHTDLWHQRPREPVPMHPERAPEGADERFEMGRHPAVLEDQPALVILVHHRSRDGRPAILLDDQWKPRLWETPSSVLSACRLVWINTPNNPTGAVLSREDLRRTWEVCRAHDILLVSDECYADVYCDTPPASLLEVPTEGVLVVHSLSKRSGLTGYRSGFIAGDPAWIARLHSLREVIAVSTPDFIQAAARVAWTDEDHLIARRSALVRRRERVLTFLHRWGMQTEASEAGLFLWVRVPEDTSGLAYANRLAQRGILVAPGEWYGKHPAAKSYIRLALCLDGDHLTQALQVWQILMEEQ